MQSQEFYKKIESNLHTKKIQLGVKRLLDLIISLLLFIILIPIYIVLVIWIKLDSKGEAVFTQTRIGKNGKPFTIYKFRTMVKDADKMFKRDLSRETIHGFVFQEKNDPRITKSGKFLRKTSLDELPQLINIIKGDMSLIGPRPEIEDVVKFYSDYENVRLLVRPGVSGLAQVNGRGNLELKQTINYDIKYIDNFSLWNDFKIFLKTFKVVFLREGAF